MVQNKNNQKCDGNKNGRVYQNVQPIASPAKVI